MGANRPIYINRFVSRGYAGDHWWSDYPRGYCTVSVDEQQVHCIGPVPVRTGFHAPVTFVAARGKRVGPWTDPKKTSPLHAAKWRQSSKHLGTTTDGTIFDVGCETVYTTIMAPEIFAIDMERGLFLTKEYLLDVFWLISDRARTYR
jgi:hypothetical protein